jgi:hypothetical protein
MRNKKQFLLEAGEISNHVVGKLVEELNNELLYSNILKIMITTENDTLNLDGSQRQCSLNEEVDFHIQGRVIWTLTANTMQLQ